MHKPAIPPLIAGLSRNLIPPDRRIHLHVHRIPPDHHLLSNIPFTIRRPHQEPVRNHTSHHGIPLCPNLHRHRSHLPHGIMHRHRRRPINRIPQFHPPRTHPLAHPLVNADLAPRPSAHAAARHTQDSYPCEHNH